MATEVLSIRADAARVLVGGYTVHLELASTRPDGTYAPELQLAIPLAMAADLANLLLGAVREARENVLAASDAPGSAP